MDLLWVGQSMFRGIHKSVSIIPNVTMTLTQDRLFTLDLITTYQNPTQVSYNALPIILVNMQVLA